MSLASLGLPGRNLMPDRTGFNTQVIAGNPQILPIGASIDWSLISATGAAVTLPDEQPIPAGVRYFRYGQVFARITGAGAYVVTVTASAGGTFTLTVANSSVGSSTTATTAAIPVGATAGDVAQALWALNDVGFQNATVTGAGPYNVTFPGVLGTTTLTAGSGCTVAAGSGGNPRFFGPYDSTATDGRQTLRAGDCWIANRTRVAGGTYQRPYNDDQHVGECIIGGQVWGLKVIATDGTASLAAGPTWAALRAAMPNLLPMYC